MRLLSAMWLGICFAVLSACATPARAGGDPEVFSISGEVTVTGRDASDTDMPLGSGPFTIDLLVPFPCSTVPGVIQQNWSSAFIMSNLQVPSAAFPRN